MVSRLLQPHRSAEPTSSGDQFSNACLCALATHAPAASLLDSQPCEFPVLATEELFGGKIKAMIDRRHPRDVYDLYRFAKSDLKYDPEILRKLAVLFGSTMDNDFRTYTIERASDVNAKQIDILLYPLLKPDDRPRLPEMLTGARPPLQCRLYH